MYPNPFRARASEQHRDLRVFLRNYGAGIVEILPRDPWDRLLVIRSAPGGGKTSLMRLFTTESLTEIYNRKDDFLAIHEYLEGLNVLSATGPNVLGVMLNLGQDYRTLRDLGVDRTMATRLFLRLLDSRLLLGFMRAFLVSSDLRAPEDLNAIRITVDDSDDRGRRALTRLGGPTPADMYREARSTEDEVLEHIDSLLPVDWECVSKGHQRLYALDLLSSATFEVSGTKVDKKALIMLDDAHALPSDFRRELLKLLVDRVLNVSRWVSERFEALEADEMIRTGEIENRDYSVLEIERAAAEVDSGRRTNFRFGRLLVEIGNLRAGRTLDTYAETGSTFSELLSNHEEEAEQETSNSIRESMRQRVRALVPGIRTYDAWIDELENGATKIYPATWRELEIVISRHMERPTQDLFDEPLPTEEWKRLSDSTLKEAASLFVAEEFNQPYYFGVENMTKLGSHNIEQFLGLSGDLFEEILAALTMRKSLRLSPRQQHNIVRRTSERIWKEIPRRVPYGWDVRRLLTEIVKLARRETFRSTAPYAPGVSGTALLMRERDVLLDRTKRGKFEGADSLVNALGSAIAANLLHAHLDRSVKNERFMVLYLNRLICPRFGLPLGRGGFRERRLTEMCAWITDGDTDLPTPDASQSLELPL